MKKKNIIIILVAILVILIGGFYIYKIVINKGKEYEITKVNQYNYFVLKQNEQYGVIDKKGNVLIDSIYDEIKIPNPEKPVFVCYKSGNTKVLNDKKEEILNEYNKVEAIRLKNIASDLMYEKSVLRYSQDGKYGLIDFEGKQLTKPIYDELDSLPYKEGELLIKQDDKYGIINIKGNKIVNIEYDKISVDGYYTDGENYKNAGYIVGIKTDEGYRYGYTNSKGKEILKNEYNEMSRVTEIEDTENAYLICAKNGQYGVTKNEQTIIANEYQSITYDETNKVFVVEKSKKYGIVNMEGKEIVPVQYNQIDITGMYLYAQNEQGTTVYNSNGTQANIDSNVAILNTSNEKYKIRINNENGTKYGVINKEGKQLIEEKYNYITYLYDNYFIVSDEKSKLGVVDEKENVKIQIKYDSLQKIQGTDLIQTTISKDKTTQVFSKDMKMICEMENATIDVQGDYIIIHNENEEKYISKEGKELKNTEVYSDNKLFAKMQDEKWGYVDRNGKTVVDYKYDKTTEFNKYGFASVKKDGKWGAINEQGEELVEPKFEMRDQTEPSFIGKYYQVIYGFGEYYYTDDI